MARVPVHVTPINGLDELGFLSELRSVYTPVLAMVM